MQAHIIENTKAVNDVDEYIIDDGKKEIPVKNKLGEVLAVLRFRTTDVNIIERAQQAEKNITEAFKPLYEMDLNPDGTAKNETDMSKLADVEKCIKDEINYVFNDDVSSDLFKKCSPFSPIGNKFFFENVIDALFNIVYKEMNKQHEEHIRRYTDDLE